MRPTSHRIQVRTGQADVPNQPLKHHPLDANELLLLRKIDERYVSLVLSSLVVG
jgi:hypothetical protein